MPEPVLLDPTELKSQYRLSHRLVTRIGALLKRRIGLSPVVIESALPGSAFERLLLDPYLAALEHEVPADALNQRFRDLGGEENLAVIPWQGWQVLALEEEIDADEGWEASGADLTITRRGETSLTTPFSDRREIEELFTPEDIRRLRLTAMTGAGVAERVSAIRQLCLCPMPPREKVSVFLGLLSDNEKRVRAEAASALQSLGMNADVAQAIGELAEGNAQQRLLSARRLKNLIESGGDLEVIVIVRSLLRSLDDEPELEVRAAVLAAFDSAAPSLADHAAERDSILRLLVQQLREFPQELRLPAERALNALAVNDAEAVIRQLWDLVRNESEQHVRIEVLCFAGQKELPDDIRGPVIGEMADQLASLAKNDEQSIRLGNTLSALGAPACRAMLEVFPRAHPLQRAHFVELLDRIAANPASSVGTDLKDEVVRLFLKLLKTAEPIARLAILEGDLCGDSGLSQDLRARVIEEFFANLHDYHNPRTRGLVEATVARMGVPAVAPLLQVIRSTSREDEREIALPVLGKVFSELSDTGQPVSEEADDAIRVCRELAEDAPAEVSGPALDALGDICSCPLLAPDVLLKVSQDLRAGLGTSRRAFEVLRALGKTCANPSTPIEERLNTARLFFQLFRSELPEVTSEVTEVDLERIFTLGHEILAYTDMIPTLLQGFQDICMSSDIPESLRERVVDALVAKWRVVMEFKEIWGPGNMTLLLTTLRGVSEAPTIGIESQLKIFRCLSHYHHRPPVLAVLGEICARRQDDDQLALLVPELLNDSLSYWVDQDRIERTDRPTILRALAQLISVHQLGEDAEKAARLRARVLSLLFDALRHKVRGVDEALRDLAQSSGLPEETRSEIHDRLRNVFAVGDRPDV